MGEECGKRVRCIGYFCNYERDRDTWNPIYYCYHGRFIPNGTCPNEEILKRADAIRSDDIVNRWIIISAKKENVVAYTEG